MKYIKLCSIFGFMLLVSMGCKDNSYKSQSEVLEDAKLQTKFVSIATGGAAGPYNIIGTALAEIYTQELGANSKTQTTGASIENLNLLAQKKVEMAFVMGDALSDALNGVGNFSSKLENIRQLAVLYPNIVQIVTSQKSGIKSIEDLGGKRVAVGDKGSGTENNARILLAEFDMSYDDIKPDYLGFAAAAEALQNGRIDAAFFASGLPNALVLQLEKTFDLAFVSIPRDKAQEIVANKSYFTLAQIPAHTYGNAMDIPTIAIANALVTRSDLSENDVYWLTKVFFENLNKLEVAHQAAKAIPRDIKDEEENMIAPIHSGAKKYLQSLVK